MGLARILGPRQDPNQETALDKFVRMYTLGQSMRADHERELAEAENRRLLLQMRKAELKRDEIKMKMESRGLVSKEAEELEKLPGRSSDLSIPPMTGHGTGMTVEGAGPRRPVIPSLRVPGVPEMGLPGYDRPIRTMEDVLAQRHQQTVDEGRAKRESNRIQVPDQIGADYDLPSGTSIDPELVALLKDRVNVPAGVVSNGPFAQGGRYPSSMLPVIQSESTRESVESEGAAQRRNALAVANIYANANRNGIGRGAGSDPGATQRAIESAAQRVASGEISAREAHIMLGGVKGGLGPALMEELDKKNIRVVSSKTREGLKQIQSARSLVGKMRELVDAVQGGVIDRVEASVLLEGYAQATAAMMSKGFGETGRLAEGDINRVLSIAPGWKSANFNKDFAYKELDTIQDVFDRAEQAMLDSGYRQYERTPTGGTQAKPQGNGIGSHGAAVKRRRMSDGSYQMMDAQGNTWIER